MFEEEVVSWNKKIIDDHPLLYSYYIPFECNIGWKQIITDLSDKLENVIKNNDWNGIGVPFAIQVKEKFGGLRFYMTCSTKEMDDLIHQAEVKSFNICEFCGRSGKLRKESGWLSTLCEEHFKLTKGSEGS